MDLSTFDAALKDYYTDDHVEELMIRDRPGLGVIPKTEKFPGRNHMPIPVVYGDPQNVSSDFTNSLARSTEGTTRVEAFYLTRKKLYNIVTIDTETLEAATGGDASWLDAQTTEIDNALEAISNRLAQLFYRSGWGDIGTVSAIAGSTITLLSVSDHSMFEQDMYVGFSASLASSVLRGTGGGAAQFLKVLSVNRSTGVVTFTTAVSSVTGGGGVVAVSDTIFTKGDRQDSATPVQQVPAGLEGWAPVGGPSATPWFSVDRTKDSRLGGVSYNGTSDAPEDAIIQGLTLMAEQGKKGSIGFVSYRQFAKIVKNQRLLERFVDKSSNVEIGFSGVTILGPKGPCKIYPDQYCPNNRAFLIDPRFFKMYSLKKAVRVIDNDGAMARRQPTADGVEVRLGFKGNFGSGAPNGICNVQLTPV